MTNLMNVLNQYIDGNTIYLNGGFYNFTNYEVSDEYADDEREVYFYVTDDDYCDSETIDEKDFMDEESGFTLKALILNYLPEED